MEFLKSWTYTISITLLISVVFSLLSPKGNMGKFFKIVLSCFIFLSCIYPIKNDGIDISFPDFEITDSVEKQNESYEEMIAHQIKNCLDTQSINYCAVNVDAKLKGDEIYINSVGIAITDSESKEDVEMLVFNRLGIKAEVYYIGE